MMASQAAIFAQTIAGIKKAVKRNAYDSDSDSSIEHLTNRGNKLKKRARYVHVGQLAPPTGPAVYKRKIIHAGFERDIISRNHTLIDEDGYEVDSDDEDERAQIAIADAAEADPYSNIKIEEILAPLTSASDLPNHPTLSRPFHSKTLTILTRQAEEMLRKEKESLWRVKGLLTRLSGDNTWIPCESVETDSDIALFYDTREEPRISQAENLVENDDGDLVSNGTLVSEDGAQLLLTEKAYPMHVNPSEIKEVEPPMDSDAVMATAPEVVSSANDTPAVDRKPVDKQPPAAKLEESIRSNLESPLDGETATLEGNEREANLEKVVMEGIEPGDNDGIEDQDHPAPRRMRTRAQVQAASDNTTRRTGSGTPDSNIESLIHPYFLAPKSSYADRDLGLPHSEAGDTRRLLQLYIQKQGEVVRGAQKIFEGLQKANQCRAQVMKWCKAEAHAGINRDMSDGEDWYDPDEWGLAEGLKKGENEEDEDPTTAAKKTRTRRQ